MRRLLPTRKYVFLSTSIYVLVTAATANGALIFAAALLGAVSGTMYQWFRRWYVPFIVHALWTIGVVGLLPIIPFTPG